MRSPHFAALLSLGILPALAAAQGQPILQGDSASMCLIMMDANFNSLSVNSLGDRNVLRGGLFDDIGASRNGVGHIQATWNVDNQATQTVITAILRTTDGGQFMPPSAQINGQPAVFWTWHFGLSNPVDFQPWVTSVTLNSAHVFVSSDEGQTFSGSVDMTNNLPHSFLPGRDPGLTLASIGDGTNFIMMEYDVTAVPAPGGIAAIAGGALLSLRRRRR